MTVVTGAACLCSQWLVYASFNPPSLPPSPPSPCSAVELIGDFNGWQPGSTPLERNQFGVWSVTLPHIDGKPAIQHSSRVKVGASEAGRYCRRHCLRQVGATASGRKAIGWVG